MKVHELLDAPEKWIQKAFCQDGNGINVSASGSAGVCWCAAGAVIHCYPDKDQRFSAFTKLTERLNGQAVSEWNDDPARTFEEVRCVFLELDL